MDLKFCSIQIKLLDSRMMDEGSGWSWSEGSVEMMDRPMGGYPGLTAKVPVRTDVSQTIAQVRQQAAQQAAALLRAVADLIEAHGPEKLARMQYEEESAETRGSDRSRPN